MKVTGQIGRYQTIQEISWDNVENIIKVALPHWNGPSDCLHLMSNLSPIDKDLYLIYPRLLPVSFLKYLSDMNIDFITVPEVEYKTMGCNVLAIEPKKLLCLMEIQ